MTDTGPEQRGRVVPAAVVGGTTPAEETTAAVGEAEGSAPGVSRGSRLGWGWGSNGDTVLGRRDENRSNTVGN